MLNQVFPQNKTAIDDAAEMVTITWEDGQIDKYPSVWLRDNCQCNNCFDHASKQRKLLMRNLDVDISLEDEAHFDAQTNEVCSIIVIMFRYNPETFPFHILLHYSTMP